MTEEGLIGLMDISLKTETPLWKSLSLIQASIKQLYKISSGFPFLEDLICSRRENALSKSL